MTGVGKAFCPHAGICGGCDLLDFSYAEQLKRKSAALSKLLGVAQPVEFEPVFSEHQMPSGFRQKVSFVFGSDPRSHRLVMGHYSRGSKTIVPVTACAVHSARGNRIAFAFRDQLIRAGIEAAGSSRRGVLKHLQIRTSQDDREAVAMLVVTRNDPSLRRPVRALLDSADRPDGFFVNIHDGPGPFMVGPETIRIAGQRHIRETINGISYLVSPNAFFQTNALAAAALQRLVVSWVKGGRVLDLYCGSGLFSLALARDANRVIAIEENSQAIKDGQANARLNRIDESRLRFMCTRVEEYIHRLSKEPWDAVVLDPPRQGCPRVVIESVFGGLQPESAVYVSCNPEALAQELPVIVKAGYRIDRLRAVDMFPHTEHIETVVRLSRT